MFSKLVCNVNIVYGNLNSENAQDYAQKPQRNYTFMNLASEVVKNRKAASCPGLSEKFPPLSRDFLPYKRTSFLLSSSLFPSPTHRNS